MAHGQAQRPIESEDGTKVSIRPGPDGLNELAASDRTVLAVLEELLVEQRKTRIALELLLGEEIEL